jgi:hypothetical protein
LASHFVYCSSTGQRTELKAASSNILTSGASFILPDRIFPRAIERKFVPSYELEIAGDIKAKGLDFVILDCEAPFWSALLQKSAFEGIVVRCVAESCDNIRERLNYNVTCTSSIARSSVLGVYTARSLTPMQYLALSHASESYVYIVQGSVSGLSIIRLGDSSLCLLIEESPRFRELFEKIYETKKWGGKGELGGGSGFGSSLEYTLDLRGKLTRMLVELKIDSFIDSSVGSFMWMPFVLEEANKLRKQADSSFNGVKFLGTDVACKVISKHQEAYANSEDRSFKCLDYARESLPHGYQAVFSRDSLQHVPISAAYAFLNNVRQSGAKYLIVGSYLDADENRDIKGGAYYSINLLKPPFNLRPPPLHVLEELPGKKAPGTKSKDPVKHLLVFDMATLEWDDDGSYMDVVEIPGAKE